MYLNSLSGGVENLKAKAVDFTEAMNNHDRVKPDKIKFPKEYNEWLVIKNYGEKTKSTVQFLTRAADKAASLWQGAARSVGFDGMGIIPLIPVLGVAASGAVIASSIAAMTYFISSAYEYGKFADSTPEVRAELAAKSLTGGIGGALGSIKTILIVGAIIYFAPKIFDMVKGRK